MTSYAETIHERLQALVGPLREEERKLDARIVELETELHTLRPIRVELRRQIRSLTGEPAVNRNGKPHANSKAGKRNRQAARDPGGAPGISGERMDTLLEWLREHEHEHPDGFSASALVRIPSFPLRGSGQSTTSRAFRVLQERGVIVLDHLGGSGQAKFYKLAPAPGRGAAL